MPVVECGPVRAVYLVIELVHFGLTRRVAHEEPEFVDRAFAIGRFPRPRVVQWVVFDRVRPRLTGWCGRTCVRGHLASPRSDEDCELRPVSRPRGGAVSTTERVGLTPGASRSASVKPT